VSLLLSPFYEILFKEKEICEFHEYESYDSERIGRSEVVFYYCLNCNAEKEEVFEDKVEEEEI
jgi:hypothetical protein